MSKVIFAIKVFPSDVAEDCLSSVNIAFKDSNVEFVVRDVAFDFCIRVGDAEGDAIGVYTVATASPKEAGLAVSAASSKGKITLPDSEGLKRFEKEMFDNTEKFRKLKLSTSKHSKDQSPLALGLEPQKPFSSSVKLLHYTAVDRFLPDAAEILSKRAKGHLARKKSSYSPLATRAEPGEDSVYSDAITSQEHRTKALSDNSEMLLSHGIDPSANSDMNYSQLCSGLPYPGAMKREQNGYARPDSDFIEAMSAVVKFQTYGLNSITEDMSDQQLAEMTTRAAVKPFAFQGSPLYTTDHTIRKTGWAWQVSQPDGIFSTTGLEFPMMVGFRDQNGKGKRRTCYLIKDDGVIVESLTIDGEDFSGHENPELAKSSNTFGARIRQIFNASSLKNDSLVVVASYFADTKDITYKACMQPDTKSFRERNPSTEEFFEFWKLGYEGLPRIRELAKERGCDDLESLVEMMRELGEWPISGDMANFDGHTTAELAFIGLKMLLSDKAMAMVEDLWFSDLLGVYKDGDDKDVYYIIDRSKGQKARSQFDLLPSGLGVTSVIGRQIVPAFLLDCIRKACGLSPFDLVSEELTLIGTRFSIMATIMQDAGDDHSNFFLGLWLLTGKHPRDIRDSLEKVISEHELYSVAPENPQMNSGYLLHTDEEGKYYDISLSGDRMFNNQGFPEHARSALGLYESSKQYISSSVGTPEEDKINDIFEFIVHDYYNFSGVPHLEAAVEEDIYKINEIASRSGAAAELIAAQLDIPVQHLEWKYSFGELLELGIDEDLLSLYREPIPDVLTKGIENFINIKRVRELHVK